MIRASNLTKFYGGKRALGPVTFEIETENFDELKNLTVGVALQNSRSQRVAFFHTLYHSNVMVDGSKKARFVCTVPSLPLVPAPT